MAWVLSRALIYKRPGTERVRAQSFDFFYLHRNTFFICIAILFYLQRFFFICSVSLVGHRSYHVLSNHCRK